MRSVLKVNLADSLALSGVNAFYVAIFFMVLERVFTISILLTRYSKSVRISRRSHGGLAVMEIIFIFIKSWFYPSNISGNYVCDCYNYTMSEVISEPKGSEPESETARLEAFSDGVFAVIITIMALELRAPASAGLSALEGRLPSLVAYVLSFTFVGIYWNNHHHLLRTTRRLSGAVMWFNLHLLFWLSVVPVLTEWVADQYRHSLPAATYGVVALGAAGAWTLLVRALIKADGPGSRLRAQLGSYVKASFLSSATH